jgi:hypothetical protein
MLQQTKSKLVFLINTCSKMLVLTAIKNTDKHKKGTRLLPKKISAIKKNVLIFCSKMQNALIF